MNSCLRQSKFLRFFRSTNIFFYLAKTMAPNSSVSSSSADAILPPSRTMSTPSPLHRLQTTHISFEELDDYVQLTQLSKWQYKLVVSFSEVVLAPDMVGTLCQAIKQSIKRVDHDCQLHVEIECRNSELPDESFRRILAETTPNVMRKAGRICVDKLDVCGNKIGSETVREFLQIANLNKDAKYRYKFPNAFTGLIDLSMNQLNKIDELDTFIQAIGSPSSGSSLPVVLCLAGNFLGSPLPLLEEWRSKYHLTVVGDDESSGEEDSEGSDRGCSRKRCGKNCWFHLTEASVLNQKDPNEAEVVAVETDPVEALSGYITPAREESTAGSGALPPTPPSIEDMTKALLAGLKITPGQPSKVVTPDGTAHTFPNRNKDPERTGNVVEKLMQAAAAASAATSSTSRIVDHAKDQMKSEDISKSLLNLLHATSKAKEQATPPPPTGMTPNVMSLFSSAAAGSSPGPALVGNKGISLSDIEANLMRNDRVSSPEAPALWEQPAFTNLKAPLKVFTPFAGAMPLCGLELRIDPLGYRVVRVTEKPGQEGNIKEGDIITAIDGESLAGGASSNTESGATAIRSTFGKKLRDGVIVDIQRPRKVTSADLHPDINTVVERKLDFGLMLMGAGIDWRTLASKFPMAVQQAKVVCQSFGVDGQLEPVTNMNDPNATPVLTLKGPVGSVDKAMRQFCVVIVKGALLQQQQQQVLGGVS